MATTTRYDIGDNISVTDLNGRVYRVCIKSIADYSIARQLGSIDVLAQGYDAPNDTIDQDTDLFYICSNIEGDTAFNNLILWDRILDHSKTVYITSESVYYMKIVPISSGLNKSSRTIGEIVSEIKTIIAENARDYVVNIEEVNDDEDEETKLKRMLNTAKALITEFNGLETVRPLITQLTSLDFEAMTTDIQRSLTDIRAQLSALTSE